MIGKLDHLPFLGEIFYGETTSPRDSKRMVIVYRNNIQGLALLVNNDLINMNGYNENELLAAINASDILPDTCHFPQEG